MIQNLGGLGLNFRVSGLGFLIIFFFCRCTSCLHLTMFTMVVSTRENFFVGTFNTKYTGVLDANGMYKQ